jgi:hypothetical protein
MHEQIISDFVLYIVQLELQKYISVGHIWISGWLRDWNSKS